MSTEATRYYSQSYLNTTQRVDPTGDPVTTLPDSSPDHDLIVLSEAGPSILDRFVGSVSDRVSEKTLSPLLVVQQSLQE